jgi:hypothetical protein
MKLRVATILGVTMTAIALSGCAVVPRPNTAAPVVQRMPGSELVDRTVRIEAAGNQTYTMHFAPEGVVHAQFGGRNITGSWVATNTQLCFAWSGASRECWPYTAPLVRGQTVSLTSDRGNAVRVTLQ